MGAGGTATGHDAFDVVDGLEMLAQVFQGLGLFQQLLDRVLAGADLVQFQQGMGEPELEGAAAHGGHGPVQQVEQGPVLIVPVHGADEFQVAHGGRVQGHVLFEAAGREAHQMVQLGFLVVLDVGQGRGCGAQAQRHVRAVERFQGMHLELALQGGDALLQVEESLGQEGEQHLVLIAQMGQGQWDVRDFRKQDLLGAQAVDFVGDLVQGAFHDHEASGAQIEIGKAEALVVGARTRVVALAGAVPGTALA